MHVRLLLCCLVVLTATLSSFAQKPADNHGVRIGPAEVFALQDGEIKLPPSLLQGVDSAARNSLLGSDDPVATSVNAFLVRLEGHLILIDAGGRGPAFGGELGHLPERLREAGVKPESIEAVLITHLHFDHIGGLLTPDGKRAFPNAQLRLSTAEYDYWMDPALEARLPEAYRASLRQIKATLAPYQAAGACRPFAPGESPFPGVIAIAAPGHTPGHTAYTIGTGKEAVWFVGDIIHFGKVQFSKPEVTVAFDTDSAKAAATRLDLLRRAAKDGAMLGAAHMPSPGLGRVTAQAAAFEWIRVDR
jgi:glyoxylase-like metal-dependent hydrolase (beta-lactamase superfamily II)